MMRTIKGRGLSALQRGQLFSTTAHPLLSRRLKLTLLRASATFVTAIVSASAPAASYTWGGGTFVPGVVAPQTLLGGDTLELKSGGTLGNQNISRFWGFNGPGTVFVNEGRVFSSIPFDVRFENYTPTNTVQTIANNGSWELGNIVIAGSTGSYVFENSGTLRQLANTRSSFGAMLIRNTGTIETLSGAELSASFILGNGSRLLGAGRVVAPGVQAQGAFLAENLIASGFSGSQSTLTGQMRIITLSGQLAVNPGSSLQWLATSQTLSAGTSLLNQGAAVLSDANNSLSGPVLTLQGSAPRSAIGARVENAGTLTIATADRKCARRVSRRHRAPIKKRTSRQVQDAGTTETPNVRRSARERERSGLNKDAAGVRERH